MIKFETNMSNGYATARVYDDKLRFWYETSDSTIEKAILILIVDLKHRSKNKSWCSAKKSLNFILNNIDMSLINGL